MQHLIYLFKKFSTILIILLCLSLLWSGSYNSSDVIECANLIYAGTKSSICFSDTFLSVVSKETSIRTSRKFKPVKISEPELFSYPFAMMTGEGSFSLTQNERSNLTQFLNRGGFLLASAGCSNELWDDSFREEIKKIFPEQPLTKIEFNHPLFNMIYNIKRLETKIEDAHLEGIIINSKLVVVYSPDGLNDTQTMHGCCCCGGNEIKNSQQVNSNIIIYALLQ